jgi:uncharacterized protein YcbX
MHVARVGFTVLKGGRHVARPEAVLDLGGPVGDRAYCLLDPARDRVVRTVENPTMVQVVAALDGPRLSVTLPGGEIVDSTPATGGEVRTVDYWGRREQVELVEGPWASVLSRHLGYDVRLARVLRPAGVVYGAPVSVVTTSSLDELSRRVGTPVEAERFRPTLVLDTAGLPPHVEDGWAGRELRVGDAVVRVRAPVPRCAVVDLDPVSGARTLPLLRTLAGYRRDDSEICFGVDADVTVAGQVRVGGRAVLGRD